MNILCWLLVLKYSHHLFNVYKGFKALWKDNLKQLLIACNVANNVESFIL